MSGYEHTEVGRIVMNPRAGRAIVLEQV